MFIASLADPVLRRVRPSETAAVADAFICGRTSTRTRAEPLVELAYRRLEEQTDRQFAALTDTCGRYRFRVAATRVITPYATAGELIASVRATRTLEIPAPDRAHPLLGGEPGSAHWRLRAVHDLIGHAATGFGFDRDGEYSAWLAQRRFYTGLARWAAATELHGEVSALWATGEFAEHKAVLLDRRLLAPLVVTASTS
jgi:hypothetical protein